MCCEVMLCLRTSHTQVLLLNRFVWKDSVPRALLVPVDEPLLLRKRSGLQQTIGLCRRSNRPCKLMLLGQKPQRPPDGTYIVGRSSAPYLSGPSGVYLFPIGCNKLRPTCSHSRRCYQFWYKVPEVSCMLRDISVFSPLVRRFWGQKPHWMKALVTSFLVHVSNAVPIWLFDPKSPIYIHRNF